MLDISFANYTVFIMLLVRISGMIFFNPLLSRRSVPTMIKAGLVLAVSVILMNTMADVSLSIDSPIEFAYIALKELGIGWVFGFILQLYMSIILISGEVMDMQMGVSMSKVYDPSSNVQMPLSGSFLNVMFMVLFFLSNSHLTMIRMFMVSYNIIPVGAGTFNLEIGSYIAQLFSSILALSLQLALPVMAIEIITEASMGVLMKAIPQINVFVVNIQIKLLVGILVILIIIGPIGSFLGYLIDESFFKMSEALRLLASA